jgi:hypothetical protein
MFTVVLGSNDNRFRTQIRALLRTFGVVAHEKKNAVVIYDRTSLLNFAACVSFTPGVKVVRPGARRPVWKGYEKRALMNAIATILRYRIRYRRFFNDCWSKDAAQQLFRKAIVEVNSNTRSV